MGVAAGLVAERNGGTMRGAYPDTQTDDLRDLFIPFLNSVDTCNMGECLPTDNPGLRYKYMTGAGYTWSFGNLYGFIMPDGSSYSFAGARNPCTVNSGDGKGAIYCAMIYIDINGPQGGPNRVGWDLYTIYLGDGFIAPSIYGGGFDNCSSHGYGCARYILQGDK